MHLQGRRGFLSHTHIDDFGGAEGNEPKDAQALTALQDIMHKLGMVQAGSFPNHGLARHLFQHLGDVHGHSRRKDGRNNVVLGGVEG